MPASRLTLAEFAARLENLARLPGASVRIGTRDARAAQLLRLFEYGSAAGELPWPRPGPRTTEAVDPETGVRVIVALSAPQGFIRVRAPQFLDALRRSLGSPLTSLEAEAVAGRLAEAVDSAAAEVLAALRGALPDELDPLAASLEVLAG